MYLAYCIMTESVSLLLGVENSFTIVIWLIIESLIYCSQTSKTLAFYFQWKATPSQTHQGESSVTVRKTKNYLITEQGIQ